MEQEIGSNFKHPHGVEINNALRERGGREGGRERDRERERGRERERERDKERDSGYGKVWRLALYLDVRLIRQLNAFPSWMRAFGTEMADG